MERNDRLITHIVKEKNPEEVKKVGRKFLTRFGSKVTFTFIETKFHIKFRIIKYISHISGSNQ